MTAAHAVMQLVTVRSTPFRVICGATAMLGTAALLWYLLRDPSEAEKAADAEALAAAARRGWRPEFVPTAEWCVVPEGAVCPKGLEYKMDLQRGVTLARLSPTA
eukprot:gnl/TRDRNA2_/TRDRNA2_82875_c0_seq1.p1 gnl/TRDRNA2_/TRDRNA2_82875_c0~~gnl/TRDRNA2_/TRDRNA2_82875_c0_seq1.p1  ORF type:complete len:104 (-),score=23.78 gnl/TRDRNA2_/TRDRNA2_82875_c0_seq1:60-371(-)